MIGDRNHVYDYDLIGSFDLEMNLKFDSYKVTVGILRYILQPVTTRRVLNTL